MKERIVQRGLTNARAGLNKGRQKWRKVVTGSADKRIRDHFKEAPQVKLIDKFSFTLGVGVMVFTEYILLRWPRQFWLWYSFVVAIVVSIRIPMYHKEKWHYFLFDFCYFVQLTCFCGIYLFPDSPELFAVNFVFANGPLVWAIVAWRNSLVFHSLDKVTSVIIHAFPPMLWWCERWWSAREPPVEQLSWRATLGLPVAVYMLWQVLYVLKTEVVDREKLDRDPALVTSLRWLSRDSHNPMNRGMLVLLRKVGVMKPSENFDPNTFKTKLFFILAQLVYTVVTMLPVAVLYTSYVAHSLFLFGVFCACVWNGASYYIEVFSRSYHLKFQPKPTVAIPAGSAVGAAASPVSPASPGLSASAVATPGHDEDDEFEECVDEHGDVSPPSDAHDFDLPAESQAIGVTARAEST